MPLTDRIDVTLRLVRTAGTASLSDLASRLGVSEMTVRRDLDALQQRGLVQRVRGGAVALAGPAEAVGFAAREPWQRGAKRRLAEAVALQVAPGSTVLLDAGTTTAQVADVLASSEGLTVATLSLQAAGRLADAPGVRLLLLGGQVRRGEHSLVGPLAAAALRTLSPDLFVMSIGAVDPGGWSEFELDDAAVKQVALERARRTVVVADASKLGVRAFAHVADLGAVDALVTDASAADPSLSPSGQDTLAALADADVEVVLA